MGDRGLTDPAAWVAWTTRDVAELRARLDRGESYTQIGRAIGRSPGAVRFKARSLGLTADRSVLARIRRWCEIDEADPDACWIWVGYRSKCGAARMSLCSRGVAVRPTAMRAAGIWNNAWKRALSACGDERCVRPDHGTGLSGPAYMRHLYARGVLGGPTHVAAIARAVRRHFGRLDLQRVRRLRALHAAGRTAMDLLPHARGIHIDSLRSALAGRTWPEPRPASVFSWQPTDQGRRGA